MMLLLLSTASAGEVVVYGGDPRRALEVAAASLDAPAGVRLVRPTEIPGADRPLVLGAATPFCRVEGAGNAVVREQVSRAEGHLAYQRTAEARAVLDAAAQTLHCLPEPIEASLAGRLFFLRGVVALREGDAAAADRVFRLAARFEPGLTWDTRFPPDPTGTFGRAVAPVGDTVTVSVGLGPGSSVWVDGRAPAGVSPLVLPPGTHYLQVLDNGRAHTAVLSIQADLPLSVVTPGWLAAVDLAALDTSGRRTLAAVLAQAYPGDTVYAVVGGHTWRVGGSWQELPGRARPEPWCGAPRRCTGLVVGGAGAGLLLGGATSLVVAQLRVGALAESPDGETADAYTRRVGAQEEAAAWLPVGGVIAGVGAVLTVAGVVLELPGGAAVAWSGPGLVVAGHF